MPLITLEAIWSKATALLQGENSISPAPGADRLAHVVLSYRSDTPHLVRPKGKGQYICDERCPQWVSAKICSHTVAVSALNGVLEEFLAWYRSSGTIPNVTSLAMAGMPSNRGCKKGQSSHSRKGARKKNVPPDTIIALPPGLHHQPASHHLVPACMSNPLASSPTMHSSSQSSLRQQAQAMFSPSIVMPPSNTCGVTPLGQQQVSPVIPSTQEQLRPTPPPLIFVGQSNNYSSPTMNVPGGAASAMSTPASQSSSAVPPNTNPFYLKFISGNIRMCQGCHSTLRPGGVIPNPPYNLTVARAEKRPYRNSGGVLVMPARETTSHYHCSVQCIRSCDPNFVPGSLRIPTDIYSQLNPVHREYLRGAFGLGV